MTCLVDAARNCPLYAIPFYSRRATLSPVMYPFPYLREGLKIVLWPFRNMHGLDVCPSVS